MASLKRITEILDTEIDLTDEEACRKDAVITRGDVEFRNVSFSYFKDGREGREKVLSDISFHIKAGETVGIIGSTGCGKTSLVQLIPRLYDTDTGEVCVDGVNVKDYSLRHLRDSVSIV